MFIHFTDSFFLLYCSYNLGLEFGGEENQFGLSRSHLPNLTDHVTLDDVPGIIRRWNMNSGNYHTLLSCQDPQKWVRPCLSRHLEGQTQPGRKAATLALTASGQAGHGWEPGAADWAQPIPVAGEAALLTGRGALTQLPSWLGSFSKENLQYLSLIPETGTSPEVTWANFIHWPYSSSPKAGLSMPMYKMNQTSWGPGRRDTIVWSLGALFPVHPLEKGRTPFLTLASRTQRCHAEGWNCPEVSFSGKSKSMSNCLGDMFYF